MVGEKGMEKVKGAEGEEGDAGAAELRKEGTL